jgi:hypothetical protein
MCALTLLLFYSTMVIWGVTLPPKECTGLRNSACGNSWIPIRALRVDTSPISVIYQNPQLGLIAAGDTDGNVVMWETVASRRLSTDEDSAGASSPDETFREKLRSRVEESVSSVAVIVTAMFVGTSSGRVYASTDIRDSRLALIPSLTKLNGTLGAVAHLMIAPFYKQGCGYSTITALYVFYSNGYLAIVNAFTRDLLGFTRSSAQTITNTGVRLGDSDAPPCLNYDSTGLGYYPVAYAGVLSSKFAVAAETLKVPSSAEGEVSPKAAEVEVERAPAEDASEKRQSWLASKISRPSAKGPELSRSSSGSGLVQWPEDAPKYLIRVCYKTVVMFDLSKIASPSNPRGSTSRLGVVDVQESTSKIIHSFSDAIVAANLVSYIEDSARFWSSPVTCLACVDATSTLTELTFANGRLHDLCSFNILQEKLSVEVALMPSLMLPNGNIYMRQSDVMIFSATPADEKFVAVQSVPLRSRTECVPPAPTQLLMTGLEDGTLSLTKADGATGGTAKKAKRRSIIGSMASAPAELDKLFAKTFDQLQKEELFGKDVVEEDAESDEDTVGKKTAVKGAAQAAALLKSNVMDETRQAFEERGEKLSKLKEDTEKLSLNAQQYREQTHAHKERLRQKAARWGLF